MSRVKYPLFFLHINDKRIEIGDELMKLVGWNCPNESRAPHKLLGIFEEARSLQVKRK